MQIRRLSHLKLHFFVILFCFYFRLNPLFASVDMSKFDDGKVHLRVERVSTLLRKYILSFIAVIRRPNITLTSVKTLLHNDVSELEFYGDLVYTFSKDCGEKGLFFFRTIKRIVTPYKKICYNTDILRQFACMVQPTYG